MKTTLDMLNGNAGRRSTFQKSTALGTWQSSANFDAEIHEAKAISQSLLDTEHGFIKELGDFLTRRDIQELRKKELLYKRWTEHVWTPIQRRVREHVSRGFRRKDESAERMLARYLDHCNAKGCVFLETYNPVEYNPFQLQISKPHYFKVTVPGLRDPLLLSSRSKMQEERVLLQCLTD